MLRQIGTHKDEPLVNEPSNFEF